MSLLMEALRKAEEAKRKSQETEAPPAPATAPVPTPVITAEDPALHVRATPLRSPFALEPREPEPAPFPESSTFASEQDTVVETVVIETPRDEVQDYLVADPAPEDNTPAQASAGRRQRGRRSSRDQLAAASVFAAKQGTQRDGKRHKRLMVLLGSGFVLLMSGGATLWYLQSMPSSGLAINPGIANYDLESRGFLDEQASVAVDTPVAASPPAVVAAPAASPEQAPAAADVQPPVADPNAPSTLPPDEPGAAVATADAETLAAAALATSAPPRPASAAPAATLVAAAEPDAGVLNTSPPAATPLIRATDNGVPRTLEITRSTSRSVVNSTLQSAWNALQAGELQTAALLYAEVLSEQPNDRDALIGTAAIQLRNGQTAEARRTYVHLLTLNPQDPYARTGLLQASQDSSDPAHETELQNLLQRYPELPPLHFALGNFYAGQQRWNEAQVAYFDALLYANRDSNTPVSPDYAFNLAVSLEQLQQPAPALNYYRQALELSRSSPAGFDMSLLQSRLGQLQVRTQE